MRRLRMHCHSLNPIMQGTARIMSSKSGKLRTQSAHDWFSSSGDITRPSPQSYRKPVQLVARNREDLLILRKAVQDTILMVAFGPSQPSSVNLVEFTISQSSCPTLTKYI